MKRDVGAGRKTELRLVKGYQTRYCCACGRYNAEAMSDLRPALTYRISFVSLSEFRSRRTPRDVVT